MPSNEYLYCLIKALHEDRGETAKVLRIIARSKNLNQKTLQYELKNFQPKIIVSPFPIPQRTQRDSDYDYLRKVLKCYLEDKFHPPVKRQISESELEEIFILVKTGTVDVTLEELSNFYETTPLGNTSDPPLAWTT